MSQENLEIVRRVLAAAAAGNREEAIGLLDPEVVVDATRRILNPETYSGVDGVRRMLAEIDETWDELRVVDYDLLDAGDKVAVVSKLVGKGRASGIEVERTFNGQVWTVAQGRVVRMEFGFTSREAMLEAAGLLE